MYQNTYLRKQFIFWLWVESKIETHRQVMVSFLSSILNLSCHFEPRESDILIYVMN